MYQSKMFYNFFFLSILYYICFQVRDVLKGIFKFFQMDEEDVIIKDDYYELENNSVIFFENYELFSQEKLRLRFYSKKSGIFYMSSEDNFENVEFFLEGFI